MAQEIICLFEKFCENHPSPPNVPETLVSQFLQNVKQSGMDKRIEQMKLNLLDPMVHLELIFLATRFVEACASFSSSTSSKSP